jgi:predicted lipoprotein with Yx(FWY)xxD motif
MELYTKIVIVLLSLLTTTAFAQYGYPATAQMPTSQTYTIMTANSSVVGIYLTDSSGMTLYHLTTDAGKDMSTCTDATCTRLWPPFYTAAINVPPNLNPSDFGTITVDGYKQTTFKGWPLYHYSGDQKAGDINGQGLLGAWSVVDPESSNTFPTSFTYK